MLKKFLVRAILLFFILAEQNFASDVVTKISDNLVIDTDKYTTGDIKSLKAKAFMVNSFTISASSLGLTFLMIPNLPKLEPRIDISVITESKKSIKKFQSIYILLDNGMDNDITKISENMYYNDNGHDVFIDLKFDKIDKFKKIAFAKTVEVRLGDEEFSIDYENRKGWSLKRRFNIR